ncbi:hypothetical protein [Dactylosporangium sp. CA-092794]|uniref:hypothetical protein n=1 Tax=Dactylosporangium sp. CA-092794 TaxID=3239929 RepID=UPI003D8BE88B
MTAPRFTRSTDAFRNSSIAIELSRRCAREINLRLLRELIEPWPQLIVESELTRRVIEAVRVQDHVTGHWAIERLHRDRGGSAEVEGLRALSEAVRGRLGEAVLRARRATRRDPAVPAFRGLLGWLLTEAGNAPAAAHTFRRMSEADPPAVAPSIGLAAALGRQGAHDEAIRLLGRLARAAGRGPLGSLIADQRALLLLASVEPAGLAGAGRHEAAEAERRLCDAARIVRHAGLAACIARLRAQVADRNSSGSRPEQPWSRRGDDRAPGEAGIGEHAGTEEARDAHTAGDRRPGADPARGL